MKQEAPSAPFPARRARSGGRWLASAPWPVWITAEPFVAVLGAY